MPSRRSSARVTLKNAQGKEINLENLKNQKLSTALSGTAIPPVAPPTRGKFNRRSVMVRIESEEEQSKRLAAEREKERTKAKAEADSKAKKEKEGNEHREREAKAAKEKQERETAEKKWLEEEAAEKERLKKEEEEKEKERLRLEKEERKKAEEKTERKRLQQEQEEKEKERIRLEKEQQEKERARIVEEKAAKVKAEAEAAAAAKPEEGEVIEETSSAEADATLISKDKAKEKDLRINTTSPPSELLRRRHGPLDLSTTMTNIPAPPPSALATARIIDDLGRVPYPEGIKSPKVELNINAKDGKFRCAIVVHRLQATVLIY